MIARVCDVTVNSNRWYETGLSDVSFSLGEGELLLVLLERENDRIPLADTVAGLLAPVRGRVEFLEEDWEGMRADHADAQRGRIGRLLDEESWVAGLEVDENIMLAQRHHTERSEESILEEALQFARMFGLPGLPRGRPASMRRWDLRKAACLRAFLGRPVLIILEEPLRGVYADLMTPLMNAVQTARRRGAAVLWTVSDQRIWDHSAIQATKRARMFGSQLRGENRTEEPSPLRNAL